jgi:hypothetical protein
VRALRLSNSTKRFPAASAGLQYLVLGPATDDPNQIDLMARKVAKNFN